MATLEEEPGHEEGEEVAEGRAPGTPGPPALVTAKVPEATVPVQQVNPQKLEPEPVMKEEGRRQQNDGHPGPHDAPGAPGRAPGGPRPPPPRPPQRGTEAQNTSLTVHFRFS